MKKEWWNSPMTRKDYGVLYVLSVIFMMVYIAYALYSFELEQALDEFLGRVKTYLEKFKKKD